jgi:hypothetical protein
MDMALRVMRVLIARGGEADIDIASAMAQTWLIEDGLEANEYEPALVTAGDKGWVVDGSRPGTIQITAAGLAAGARDAH